MKKDAEDSIRSNDSVAISCALWAKGFYDAGAGVEAVLELIKEMGGCDAGDEYARGWDAACDAFYKTIMERF